MPAGGSSNQHGDWQRELDTEYPTPNAETEVDLTSYIIVYTEL